MADENKQNQFALIALVGIVAVVGIVGLTFMVVGGRVGGTERVAMSSDAGAVIPNAAGQMYAAKGIPDTDWRGLRFCQANYDCEDEEVCGCIYYEGGKALDKYCCNG